MGIYLTEIIINGRTYCGPNIEANSFEEADEIELREYKGTYKVVGKLIGEIELED